MIRLFLAFAALVSLAHPVAAQQWTVGDQGMDWSNPVKDGDTRPTGAAPADAYEPADIDMPDGTTEADWVIDTGDQLGSDGSTAFFRDPDDSNGDGRRGEKKIRLNCEPNVTLRKDNILSPGAPESMHFHKGAGLIPWDENTDFDSARTNPISSCQGGAVNGTNYMEPALVATLATGAKVSVNENNQAIYYVEGLVNQLNDMDWIRAGTQLVVGVKPTMFNDTARRAAYTAAGLVYPGTANTPAGFNGWYCTPGVSSGTFTANTGTDAITIGNSFGSYIVTGTKVRASTSGGLPGGLAINTDYYAIVSGGTIKLASSLANAVAGTAIDITSAGTGSHAVAMSGAAFVVRQASRMGGGTAWTDKARALAGPNGEDPFGGGCAGTLANPATLASDLLAPGCWDRTNLAADGGVAHFAYAARNSTNSITGACPRRTTDGEPYGKFPRLEVKTLYQTLGPVQYIDQDWHYDSDRMPPEHTLTPGSTADPVTQGDPASIDECRQVGPYFCPGTTKHADYTYGWKRNVFDQMQRECLGIPVRGIAPTDGPAECNVGQIDRYTQLRIGAVPVDLRVWTGGCANIGSCKDAVPSKPLEQFEIVPSMRSGDVTITHPGH